MTKSQVFAKKEKDKTDEGLPKEGQGYNDARGEIPDKKDVPKNNGQNVNNDPAHQRENEKPGVRPNAARK